MYRQKNKTNRLTLRNPNYKYNKINSNSFYQNNPLSRSIVPVERSPTISINSVKANKYNKKPTYTIRKLEPTNKGTINTFKHTFILGKSKLNKSRKINKLKSKNFNIYNNKYNIVQEANIQRIPNLNSSSITSYTNINSNTNKQSINSRSTIKSNKITNYKTPGIKYIHGLTYSNNKPIKQKASIFTNKHAIKSWRGKHTINDNNNNNISNSNNETWINTNSNNDI
jgi:hypothetical protein